VSPGCFYLLVSFVAFTITCCIHYFSVILDLRRDLSYECGVCDRNDSSQSLTTNEKQSIIRLYPIHMQIAKVDKMRRQYSRLDVCQ